MTKHLTTIEDLLEILAGLQGHSKIQIESSDATIMYSVARQVFRGTSLSDRQFALMQEKLLKYKNQFTALEYDFDTAVATLRKPLRQIDRRKFLKLLSTDEAKVAGLDVSKKWICVRFPFSKSLISLVNACVTNHKHYFHSKGSHEHHFALTELNVYNTVTAFKDRDFEVDSELLELYLKIKTMKENPNLYVPYISNDCELVNLHPKALERCLDDIGPLNKDTVLFYLDRRRRYGISQVDYKFNPTSLTEQIAARTDCDFLSNPTEHNLSVILGAINNLQRYPLLVVIEENNAEQQLYDTFNFFRNIVDAKEQSVLFRLPNETNSDFNEYVKTHNLNNWVDKNTKIVYINNNKLPKLLVKGNWSPITAFVFGNNINRILSTYLSTYCDLIVFRDEALSLIRKYNGGRL